jgi:FemAB family protein
LTIPAFIKKIFEQSSLDIIYRVDNSSAWNLALKEITYVPFTYLENTIDFQLSLETDEGVLKDVSVIILHDKKPCAVWPLSYQEENGTGVLRSFVSLLLPPLFTQDLPGISQKKINKECIEVISQIIQEANIKSQQSEEVFIDTPGISDWHYEWIRKSANAKLRYDLYVNLSLDIEKIKNSFRKSYRSLVSSGLKTWQTGKLDHDDPAIWDAFRELHIRVAGRETRNKPSWDTHYQALLHGNAFLIYLRNDIGEMVGGGLFIHSEQECFYGVAAYDRSLFAKPLGHVVQFLAIEEMKKKDILWYKIGTRSFASELPAPTEKEISITEFKEGFATDIMPKYILELPVN